MYSKFLHSKDNLIKYALSAVLIVGIGLPAILSVRHKEELKDSALDIVTAVKKVQAQAKSRKENVALAIDRVTGVYTAFVDDGGVAYEKSNHLPLTPEKAANLQLDPNETVLFRERIHRIDVVKNDRTHPFPKTEAIRSASGELIGGIMLDGKLLPGVEFDAQGRPTNLGTAETAYHPCSGSSMTGLFSILDIKSTTNPIDRYQVAMNSATGEVYLLLSVNGGQCYQ